MVSETLADPYRVNPCSGPLHVLIKNMLKHRRIPERVMHILYENVPFAPTNEL